MDKICDYSKCSACGACRGVCPKNCISLVQDIHKCGHVYPVINKDECIDCGLCTRTCPVNNPAELRSPLCANAAYALDDNVCDSSASGGLAYSLGKKILDEGGVVYGCIVEYGEYFSIRHEAIRDIDSLSRTQDSKYVRSDIARDIYQQIKIDLKSGKKVLFAGTGCQVAGVRNFLKTDYPNFYAADIICHGVPSLRVLTDFLSKSCNLSQIKKIIFRGKGNGVYADGIYRPIDNSLYMIGFLKCYYLRESCFSCRYAQKNRCGDITLGDFWGLKNSISTPGRKSTGTSVVLTNNGKGRELISSIKDNLRIESRPVDEAVAGNPNLRAPSVKGRQYALFQKIYPLCGFTFAVRLCLILSKLVSAYVLPIIRKFHK